MVFSPWNTQRPRKTICQAFFRPTRIEQKDFFGVGSKGSKSQNDAALGLSGIDVSLEIHFPPVVQDKFLLTDIHPGYSQFSQV